MKTPPPAKSHKESTSSSEQITKSSNSNLALAFILLPKDRQTAMVTFYAFCRVVDDIADSETLPVAEKRRQLKEWHEEIGRIYRDEPAQMALGKELGLVLKKYNVKQ